MGNTRIEWADMSWNPVTGCTPVSEGCRNCYAARMAKRLAGRCGYPKDDPFKVTFHPDRLGDPEKWRTPRRIFVCSMGDLFHESVQFDWIDKIFAIAALCQRHTFMLLTKRHDRMAEYYNRAGFKLIIYKHIRAANGGRVPESAKTGGVAEFEVAFPLPPKNLWLGVTAENQKTANQRIPILLSIPAAVRFVSVEPYLSQIDLTPWLNKEKLDTPFGLDWVIAGGETGPGARPMQIEWVRDLRDQCMTAGVPFFFKKWGPKADEISDCVIDGKVWSEFPDLRRRT